MGVSQYRKSMTEVALTHQQPQSKPKPQIKEETLRKVKFGSRKKTQSHGTAVHKTVGEKKREWKKETF